jgi:drug/metabolite transporter (DMT)-like permease
MRALLLGSVVLAPWGFGDALSSSPSAGSIAAVAILGVVGTGIARALAASLAGRTGASRGSLVTYLVPVIAITLGVVFRNETIEPIELAGTGVILGGAYLTTRSQRPAN